MAKLKVDQFVDLVKRSGLVDNERLNEVLSGVDQSVKDSGIVASSLTRAGLLTEWQSEKLLQGRHKGFHLGKYKLLNHIGTGGMGSVYLAEHLVMRHQVAIKLLPNHLAAHTSYLERFHQEARASAKLNHPNMVRSIDVDHEGNIHYIVMEYVDGSDLQAIVSRNGPLPYQTAADYTRQAAEGLEYAHRSGLIHRDIKPANLLVDRTGTVKILDMGLARFSDETQGSLTMAYDQKMIGTVDYLAPEQALDSHKVDARVDIYSLGCTLYFMLTGDSPFPQGTIPQRLMQHQSSEPTDIRETRPDAPEELIQICRKMMAKSADDRYQTAAEVGEALAEFLADTNDPAPSKSGVTQKYAPPAPPGPSLNEDLTLAPLDDEPGGRKAAKEVKAGESKVSGIAGKSTVIGGERANSKKTDSASLKNGEQAGHKSDKKPTAKGAAGDSSKSNDLMSELLADAKTKVETPPPLNPARKEEVISPEWLVIGVGLLIGVVVVFATFVAWFAGLL